MGDFGLSEQHYFAEDMWLFSSGLRLILMKALKEASQFQRPNFQIKQLGIQRASKIALQYLYNHLSFIMQ